MNNLIYYPTFEPQSMNWLKYALIYLEDVSPIIPPRGKKNVSDLFRKLENETNLIKSIEPRWDQGERAALKVMNEIDLITASPDRYATLFNNKNILETWKNSKNWDSMLYHEKFNIPFRQFCSDRGLGKKFGEDLILSDGLADFFMTFLAEEIAYDNHTSPITDLLHLDQLSTYLRTKDVKKDNELQAAKIIVNEKIPEEIDKIAIDRFIEFRNDSGMNELRQSFNKTVNSFYESVEQNFDPYSYLDHIKKTNKEFFTEMGLFFGGLVSVTIGGVIVLKAANPEALEILKTALEGTMFLVTGGLSISKAWKLNEDRRNARKFLSKVKRMSV